MIFLVAFIFAGDRRRLPEKTKNHSSFWRRFWKSPERQRSARKALKVIEKVPEILFFSGGDRTQTQPEIFRRGIYTPRNLRRVLGCLEV